jgi:hypothetical protein
MSHSNTQRLTDYWRERRGAALAPLRARIDPCDFADLLPQVFILGRTAPGRYSFRLSCKLLEELHGPQLRRADFTALWADRDRIGLQSALEAALRRGQAMICDARGVTVEGHEADFEILLAPLTSGSGQVDRFLGLCQPVSPLQRLRGQALVRLTVLQLRPLPQVGGGESVRPFPLLRLAAVSGRRIA